MAASTNDKFTYATNGTRPVPTTLTATRSVAATSISCGALTGWPTATKVHFVIYTVDTAGNKVANSQLDCTGIVSGSSITNIVYKAGTDNGNSIGAVVEAAPTAAWANDLIDGELAHADQDGTLKAGAVDAAAVLADGVVTTAKILDANVTNAKLSTGSGQPGGAWTAWTPTWTNLTVGNGTNASTATRIGNTIHFKVKFTLGSTSSISGTPKVSLPFTSINYGAAYILKIADSVYYDLSATSPSLGILLWTSTTDAELDLLGAAGTYVNAPGVTSTVPFTWATGDIIQAIGMYEAA